MTKLRKRMIEDMKLNGLSQRTQECYLNAVSKIAKYYMKAPNAISPEEIRRYFLRLVKDEVVTSATLHVYRAGIRFLFEKTLRRRRLPDVKTGEPPRRAREWMGGEGRSGGMGENREPAQAF
jgi:integrase/recombinase XerD